MMKYALLGIILAAAIAGAYYSGYAVGSRDVKIEYVVKEKEVIKYVEKKKAEIYSAPNAGRDLLLKRLHNGEL